MSLTWDMRPKSKKRNVGGSLAAKLLARSARGEMIDRNTDPKGKTPRKVAINPVLARFLSPIKEWKP